MELTAVKGLRKYWAHLCCSMLILCCQQAFAVSKSYPADFPPSVVPFTMGSGDTLTVTSGTMASASGVNTGYTVDFSGATVTGVTITLNQGAAMSYLGSNGGAATINSSRNDATLTATNININGSLSSGTGLSAISVRNSNAGPQDTYNINVGTTGSITGAVTSNSVLAANLNLTGNATVTGSINLSVASVGTSSLVVGATGAATFTPTQSISNIGNLHITNSSTMTLNVTNTNINQVNIDTGSSFYINTELKGVTAPDGAIVNNGSMYIAAAISKTGTMTGTGTNFVTEGSSTGLTVQTSNYRITNHTAVMVDVGNYGNMTLSTADFNLNAGGANKFAVIYGSSGYTPGYFPGGTYTLVTATNGTVSASTDFTTASLPASTLFLSFARPARNSTNTKIQIALTRTPYTTYATTGLTYGIASNLEALGSNNPSASALTLLDAVEQSGTAASLEYNLTQLAPLADAPFFGFRIQNESMRQVRLRLAELRDHNGSYFAGDVARDVHLWGRGFGAYANQLPKDDSFGYYGTAGGYAVGIDRDLDDRYTMGAAFVYVLSHVTDKVNQLSTTSVKSYIGMGYGTYNFTDTSYLDWIFAVTANNFSANRYINITTFVQTAQSSYGSQQIAVNGVLGQDYEAFGFMQLTPEAYAEYMFAKQYTYEETGAGGANLQISRTNTDMVTLALGGKAAIPFLLDPGIVMPEIHSWAYYNPIIGKQDTIFSFVDGGGPMTSIFNPSRTGITIGAALTVAVIDKLEVKFNFDYDIEDRFTAYCGYINLRYTF